MLRAQRRHGDQRHAPPRAGATLGLRGPFGNGFDMDAMKGKDVLFVAGGLGLAPARGVIKYVLDKRSDYGKVTILYGARSPKELLFTDDLAEWAARPDCDFHVTVDRPDDKLDRATAASSRRCSARSRSTRPIPTPSSSARRSCTSSSSSRSLAAGVPESRITLHRSSAG